jgi:hypothetical protein
MQESNWFKTSEPLQNGWYWWRASDKDPEPDCIKIANGIIIDYSSGELNEHTDFSGEWKGPIKP